ncbi:MAG TPA: tetratricopeptide repeat protein [Pyrinomonadaceae bacterium]|nr:tetratricopeptide repeat protein [Pyrinomonadaceae bacterium]
MTKDNILYSIIGVLLGVFVGYVFANTVNQQGYAPRSNAAAGATAAGQAAQPGGSSLPSNAVKEQGTSGEEQALIERAQAEPDNFEVQMSAAAALYRNRRFDDAIELLTRANQLRPDNYETIVSLGNANFDTERYETAEKWYTAALVKNPKDINVRTDLGLTFLFRKEQNLDRAIKEFRRSLELDPRHEQTLQNMTVALIKKGSLGEAEQMLAKLREVNPGNAGLTKLASELEEARGGVAKQPAATRAR